MLEKEKISRTKSAINKKIKIADERCYCLLCGKDVRGKKRAFHKSHTIPLFCLENIKGEFEGGNGVLSPSILGLKTPFSEDDLVSVNKAGVFYAICSECDNKVFERYESERALLETDPYDLLDAIALKTYINELYTSYMRAIKADFNYSDLTDDEMISSFFTSMARIEKPVASLDVDDYIQDYLYAKRSYEKGYCNYDLLFHAVLEYTVPIAAQVSLPVTRSIDYEKLQNATDYSSKRLNDLLAAVFPLKKHSVVFLFTRRDNFQLKKYRRQFGKLSYDEKLKEIFYLLIRYKQSGYYFSPKIIEKLDDENIHGVFSIEDTQVGLGGVNETFMIDMADFEKHVWKEELPALLSEEYSMQKMSY